MLTLTTFSPTSTIVASGRARLVAVGGHPRGWKAILMGWKGTPMNQVCVALDLETTGVRLDQDEIIEVAAVKFQGDASWASCKRWSIHTALSPCARSASPGSRRPRSTPPLPG